MTELLNNIGVHPIGFVTLFSLSFSKEFIISAEQERRKSVPREAWQEQNGPSKPRSLWNQQPHIDSAVLNRYTPMNDSSGKSQNSRICSFKFHLIIAPNVPNLMIQGQAMNINNGNGSNRQQWSGAPRGTIISVLERARVKEDTMSSTITSNDNNEGSDISLANLAKRIDPDKKHETYVIPNSTTCDTPNKPIISDLVVEDFDSTLKNQPKVLENRSLSTSDDFDLLEGLTTGHFDERNKLVRQSVILISI